MASINVKFPDGAEKQFDAGVTTEAIAKSISPSLAKRSVAGKFNDQIVDYRQPLTTDGSIEIIAADSEDGLNVLRQTAAQVLANAVKQLFPSIHFGSGEGNANGFFFDTDNPDEDGKQVSEDDLEAISDKMAAIIKQDLPIEREVLSKADALALVGDNPYQQDLVNERAAENDGQVVVYKQGDSLIYQMVPN
ncbi:Threonine--tRNA ligase [Lactiplantibacillus plantarum subsp. plantarum]|uniref:Threonine--tRNA ligase n=1 Tax=Lactiplantibacillus plantarum subsp. plantarum TaxID=337330 RepID=A0A2S3U5Y0_LACPN|nr:Threonine--tRNA ligase [Lactiplantibacillus plantarum subsp. plantarum]